MAAVLSVASSSLVAAAAPSSPRLAIRCYGDSGLSLRRIGSSTVRRVPGAGGRCRAAVRGAASADAAAERPLWLPGSTPPAHLNGMLAGDFGFDPLELGQDPATLRWYVQAELVHARFAMAGVAGILFTDLLRATGRTDVPLWFEAGAYHFAFADTKTLFIVQLLLMGFVETKRWMDFVTPGSQAAEDSFFGLEAAFEGLENGYPGGPIFDPIGLASDAGKLQPLRWKEIKNGRLAMVAMVGFIVQAYVTKTGPIENLMTHLSDPLHTTIIQTLAKP